MKLFGEKRWDADRIWRFVLGAAVIVGLYLVLSTLRAVILPFALAFVLAYLLSPIVSFLERRRMKRVVAVLIVLLSFFGIIILALSFMIPRVVDEVSNIAAEFEVYVRSTYDYIEEKMNWVDSDDRDVVVDRIVTEIESIDLSEYIQSAVFGIFRGVISLTYYLMTFAIIPIAAFFFLSDFQRIRERWVFYVPKQLREKGVPFLKEVNTIISAFFRGQLLIMLILSVLFSTGFSIARVPLAIPMGFLVGFLNLIPYFGTLVGIIPLGLLTLAKSLELGENPVYRLIAVGGIMLVVQGIEDWALRPTIMKNRVGLKPITILMSALIWGKLLGFIGLMLAIPLSAVGKVYFQRYFLVKEEIDAETGEKETKSAEHKKEAPKRPRRE